MRLFRQKGKNQLVASEWAAEVIERLHEKFPDEIQKVESEQVRKDFYDYEKGGGAWYIRDIIRSIREDNLAYFLGAAAACQLVREYSKTGRWDGLEDFLKLLRTLTEPEFAENRRPPDQKNERLKWLLYQAQLVTIDENLESSPTLDVFDDLINLVLAAMSQPGLTRE